MDFGFSEEEERFRQEIRQFVRDEIPPEWIGGIEEEYDDRNWPFTKVIVRKLADRGWLAIGWPKKYGGQEASVTKQLIYEEATSYYGIPGTDVGVGGVSWIGPCIMLFGNREQQDQHLPQIATGKRFWCTAYSEPECGSDLASMRCRAVADGDSYMITGQKTWVSAAHIADWCWLAVRTDPSSPKHKGISILLVPMRTRGITVRPLFHIGGFHCFNEVFFDEVRVPKSNLLGVENQGWHYVTTGLDLERVWPGVKLYASAKRILDELVIFVRDTVGNTQPSGKQKLIRHELSQIAVEIDIARLLAFRAALALSKGIIPVSEASMVKLYASEVYQRAANTGMKILGPYGQLDSYSSKGSLYRRIQYAYFASMGQKLLSGTSEIQRNIIATLGLGLPKV